MFIKEIYYLMIARDVTGDSELHIYNSFEEAKAKYDELVNPLIKICEDEELVEEEDYYPIDAVNTTGYRFNCGNNAVLDTKLNESNTYFEINKTPLFLRVNEKYALVEFSEHVDESNILLIHTKKDIKTLLDKHIAEHLEIMNDRDLKVNIEDKTTWEASDGMTLYYANDDKTEVYFGYGDVTCTYKIFKIF